QADMRIDATDHLAVEFQHESKHAVGGRMLRTEIDREIAKAGFQHGRTQRMSSMMTCNSTQALIVPKRSPGSAYRQSAARSHGASIVFELWSRGSLICARCCYRATVGNRRCDTLCQL